MNTSAPLPENIPELDPMARVEALPERVSVALEARMLEKAMLSEMVTRWLDELRPEMERMARQIVQRSADEYWRQHAARRDPA